MRLNTHGETLNRFLVEVFNEILKTEEQTLTAEWPDLSLREFHLIEEVCRAEDLHRDNRAGAIAAAQRVTAGTLTTAVNLLEKKGYLERRRDNLDRRCGCIPRPRAVRPTKPTSNFTRRWWRTCSAS